MGENEKTSMINEYWIYMVDVFTLAYAEGSKVSINHEKGIMKIQYKERIIEVDIMDNKETKVDGLKLVI
tara:strand:+ start:5324 stop:5530 length:207 start_codon:yes stop_codon:yes gene_type:complete